MKAFFSEGRPVLAWKTPITTPKARGLRGHKATICTDATRDAQCDTHTHTRKDGDLHAQGQTAQITPLQGDGNHLIRRDKAQLGKSFHCMCRDSLGL